MRKSLLALILVGSFLAVAATVVLAGNPAGDSIPDVGSIDVPAGSGQAGGGAVTSADADVAVLTDGAPAPAAADGLATARDSGDPLAVTPASAADGGLATAELATSDGGISGSPPAADGLATAEAAGLTTFTGVESIQVPAANEAGDNPPAAVPTGVAADGLFVAEVAGLP